MLWICSRKLDEASQQQPKRARLWRLSMLSTIALAIQKLTGLVLGVFMTLLPLGNTLVCVATILFGAGYVLAHIPLRA
jgi:uncharacterized membrane protein